MSGEHQSSVIPGLNVVFAGNFLYPVGMAGTKRVQHYIDHVLLMPDTNAYALLFRQGHVGRDRNFLRGEHKGVEYRTIGHDISFDWKLPWELTKYLCQGMWQLSSWRKSDYGRNLLFVYGPPNIENLPFVIFAKMLGYRVVFDIVEDYYLIEPGAPLLSRLKAASVRAFSKRIHWFANGLIVISDYLGKKFEQIADSRIPILRIPVSVNTRGMVPSRAGFHRPVRMVYAGSYGEKDGLENLINAFGEILEQFPEVTLELSGKGMPAQLEKINALIAQDRFAGKIHHRGFLDDESYYQLIIEADILCVVRLSSDFAQRGFPFKLGEFLATGRPVIASRIGDIPEYLVNRKNAVLVEPDSVQAIIEAMKFLLSDPAKALEIGAAGRQVAETRFDTEIHRHLFLEFISGEIFP